MLILFCLYLVSTQWVEYYSAFHQPTNLYCTVSTCPYGFKQGTSQLNALYNNCSNPKGNSLILGFDQMNTTCNYNPRGYYIQSLSPIIYFDVYFISQWNDDDLIFKYNNHQFNLKYSTQNQINFNSGFCDLINFQVKTFNISLPQGERFQNMSFEIMNPNLQAYLKNIHITYNQCYPTCSNCTGNKINDCTSCLAGLVLQNGECRCPLGTAYNSYRCSSVCRYYQSKRSNRVCYQKSYKYVQTLYFEEFNYAQLILWNIVYDYMHPPIYKNKKQAPYFGYFQYYEGTSIIINNTNFVYPLSSEIRILFCNQTPTFSGVQFYFNQTYHSSIYYNGSQYVTDNIYIYYQSYISIPNCISSYQIYVNLNSFKNYSNFILTIKGNYTTGNAGWYLGYQFMTTGYCPYLCKLCSREYVCQECISGYKRVSDGSCTYSCPYASISNATYCLYYEHLTKYSRYYLRLFQDFAISDKINEVFVLESSTDKDFKKGDYVFWSYLDYYPVFGGKYVWATARFSQIYTNLEPHHTVSVIFTTYFGYKFSSPSYLGYQINNGTEQKVQVNTSIYINNTHSSDTFAISFQCFGVTNNALDAYCAISHYYIIIHYCSPQCHSCSDENNCTQMNTYNSSIIKLTQSECLSNQFLDEDYYTCENCPSECSTCFNEYECYTCNVPYLLYITKCLLPCESNQYYDSQNLLCINCDSKCKQCRDSQNYCINCEMNHYRYLYYGECKCYDGYYDSPNFLQCQVCHSSCKKCTGSSNQQCIECKTIQNLIQNINTCDCIQGYYFDSSSTSCKVCNGKCLSCFSNSDNSCYSCNLSQNRILNGLKCQCQQGFYELNNVCILCPSIEDPTLLECYKKCGNNQSIWFDQICPNVSCALGFNNIDDQCIPICGDGLIKGDEECDDQNSIQFDGCYNCRFHCHSECTSCNLLTQIPCISICGDGIISGNEECDDKNNIQFDGCYQCKLECQIQCTNCIKGKCFECVTYGWTIDPVSQICIENCGDSMIIGREECDDGYNFDPNDSCYQCKWVCRDDCKTCSSDGKTCLECKVIGFKPYSYYCISICQDGYLAIDPYGRNTEQCDDFNNVNYDGCSDTCLFQCQINTFCTTCVDNICQECAVHYYLDSKKNKCLELCNDNFIIGNEKCEDMNNQMLDGCYNCQLSCQQSCQVCTINGCSQCKQGYNLINKKCVNKCGDGIKVFEEECDDGNLNPFDGCHACQYTCFPFCKICHKGVCIGCLDEYHLVKSYCEQNSNKLIKLTHENIIFPNFIFDEFQFLPQSYLCENWLQGQCLLCKQQYYLNPVTKLCQSLCGDQFVGIDEECDDLNNYKCQNCVKYCDYSCHQCKVGLCICENGYFLNQTSQICIIKPNCSSIGFYYDEIENICYDICGDGIISKNEECDDEQDFSCVNCIYQCPVGCKNCQLGQCLDLEFECDFGFYYDFNQKSCFNVCGDGLVAQNIEQCDDGSYTDQLSCKNCKFQCDENCSECYSDKICSICQQNYDLINGLCVSKIEENDKLIEKNKVNLCGDGIVNSDLEECDDGNLINDDGCDTDCLASDNSNCRNQECFVLTPPIPYVIFLNQEKNTQTVKLFFSQNSKLNDAYSYKDFQQSLILQIQNNSVNFTFDQNQNQEHLEQIIYVEYQSQVNDPNFTIKFTNLHIITNENGSFLLQDKVDIQLPTLCYMTQEDIKMTQTFVSVSDSQIKVIFALMIGFSLSGQFSIIQNQIDTMQQFYYLKYINTKVAFNLESYFETFKIIQLTNIYDLVGINPSSEVQLEQINLDYCESESIFESDDRNANFIVNFLMIGGIFLTSIAAILLFKQICQLLMKIIKKLRIEQLQNSKQLILHKIIQIAIKNEQVELKTVIVNIFQSILYELYISIFLSIKYQSIQNFQSIFSLSLAYSVFYLSLIYLLIYQFEEKLFRKKNLCKYFTEICIQRIIFSSILITCLNNPVIQIILCSLNEIWFFLILIQKKFSSDAEIAKKQFVHFSLFLVQFLLLLNEIYQKFSERKIIFGWISIGLMSFTMLSILIIDIYEILQPLIQKIAKLIPNSNSSQKHELFFSIPMQSEPKIRTEYQQNL